MRLTWIGHRLVVFPPPGSGRSESLDYADIKGSHVSSLGCSTSIVFDIEDAMQLKAGASPAERRVGILQKYTRLGLNEEESNCTSRFFARTVNNVELNNFPIPSSYSCDAAFGRYIGLA